MGRIEIIEIVRNGLRINTFLRVSSLQSTVSSETALLLLGKLEN